MTVTLTTRRNTAPVIDVNLFYRRRPETATPGNDYTLPFHHLTRFAIVPVSAFSPNAAGTAYVAQHAFTIGIVDDQEGETAETIVFQIYSQNNNTGSPEHTITIRDDDDAVPGRPTGLSAAAKSQTRIQLAWTTPADDGSFAITGYRIEASEDAGSSWNVVDRTRDARTDFRHGGLSAGDTRHYRVSAVSDAGASAPSDVASATTVSAGPAATNPDLPPPSDVTAAPKLPRQIRLGWWTPILGGGIDSYQYRMRAAGAGDWSNWTTVNRAFDAFHSRFLEDLDAGTIYEFQVRSVDKDDTYSAAVSALATATGPQTISIARPSGTVTEGEPLRFTLSRDQPHGRLMVILRISETGDMLPQEGRQSNGLWTKSVYFGDGNATIPVVLETVDDGDASEPDSRVTVEVMPYPLYPGNPDNNKLYEVHGSRGSATKTVTAQGGTTRSAALSVADAEATEGEDATLDFLVRLDGNPSSDVTVDYGTRDGTATAGSDYTETSGTLTFAPGEDEQTVSVPITDDAVEDDGETFTLMLSNASRGVGFADNEATGTIRNSETTARPDLTAAFQGMPAEHDGESAFTFRVAFSEDIGISFRSLREDAFTVTGGRVTRGTRVDGRRDLFEMTVEPDGDGDVTIELPAGRECATSGAICTKGENRRQLTNSPSVTVAGPAGGSGPPELTASFEGMPAEHRGEGGFHFRVAFSEDIGISFRALREDAFTVTGGRVTGGSRVDGRRDLFKMTVRPDSDGDVTITLPAGRECATSGAICTKGENRRQLTNSPSAMVAGPVGIAVADARVEEGAGAMLEFAVTFSRAAAGQVTVDYQTVNGTAAAGTDYTAANGTLTFEAGESSQTVEVAVLDDSHDEGEETMTLRLSNPSEGRLADAEATGTIENTDPLPRALLARFGRATALHVMEQVEARLEASRASGFRGRFAGRELRRGMERDMGRNFLSRLQSTAVQGARDTTGVQSDLSGAELLRRGLGGGDLLMGSGFVLNRETGGGASVSLWSRGMESRFGGRDGELSLDGGVRTTMFGADYAKGPLMAGLMLSHRRGLGGYQGGADVGQVASSVTGLHPWVGYKLTERVTLWGVTGYGRGSLSLTPGEALSLPTSLAAPVALKGGLSMSMLAGGVRGDLLDVGAGGFGLAFKADALWVGTGSEAVDGPAGRLAGTEAVVTRVRTALEASRGYVFGHGIALRPSLELGLRQDGGDAETGAGADVAASLIASDPLTGLSVDVRVRTLLVHQDEGFRERGVSVSFSYDPTPQTPLGFTARVAPSWGGQAMSGADALWGRDTMEGLGAAGPGSGDRIDAELGYALPVGSRLVGTPRFGVTTSEYGRDYRLGYSLAVVQGGAMSFQFGLDAQRRERLVQSNADHSLVGRLTVGW